MVCSKFTAKRRVDSENQQFKEEWTEKCAFILPPTSTRPMCLICQETIAVMKISNLKWHHETKHRNFEETFPENVCEWGGFWVSTRSHSCRSKKKVHDWSDGHNVWRKIKRGNIQLCILINVKMELLQYYCMWPDRPQHVDLWVIENNLCGPLRFAFEYPRYPGTSFISALYIILFSSAQTLCLYCVVQNTRPNRE